MPHGQTVPRKSSAHLETTRLCRWGLTLTTPHFLLQLHSLSIGQAQTPFANRQLISAIRQTENPKCLRDLSLLLWLQQTVLISWHFYFLYKERGGRVRTTTQRSCQSSSNQPSSHYSSFLGILVLLTSPDVGGYKASSSSTFWRQRRVRIQVCIKIPAQHLL